MVSTKKCLSGENMTRILFSADYIKDLRERVIMDSPTFSYLLGRPVQMPSKFLLREIEYFMKTVKNDPKVEIGLRPMGLEPFKMCIRDRFYGRRGSRVRADRR